MLLSIYFLINENFRSSQIWGHFLEVSGQKPLGNRRFGASLVLFSVFWISFVEVEDQEVSGRIRSRTSTIKWKSSHFYVQQSHYQTLITVSLFLNNVMPKNHRKQLIPTHGFGRFADFLQ